MKGACRASKRAETEECCWPECVDMCLVLDDVIPPMFKVQDFEKYKGVSCPDTHLRMYCRKIAAHIKNSKLMIHCFQDSLSGALLDWYMQLEKSNIRS